jgi:hypothetical protein
MGTGGPFPGAKRGWDLTLTTHPPSSAEVKNEYELYILSPQAPPWRVAGLLCFLCWASHDCQLLGTYIFVLEELIAV